MYVLCIDGFEIRHKEYNELKNIVENHVSPYEIYEVRQSAMNNPDFCITRLSPRQIDQLIKEAGRGYAQTSLAKKYRVSEWTISRTIRSQKIIQESINASHE
jgi:hypothetical protein